MPDTVFHAWDNASNSLYTVDNAEPPTATLVGPVNGNPEGIIAEIEFGDGVIYGADTDEIHSLRAIDPATGSHTHTITLSFPVEGNVLTALEFVGSTLYAGLTTEGGGTTLLSTVDLTTGVVTSIGSTGVDSPFGGLAYDEGSGTMYGISAGGSPARLFTIDLAVGTATPIALVTLDGADVGATALEFGNDGLLYSLPNKNSLDVGHLLRIDKATGDATDLGDTGYDLVALTNAPEPSAFLLGAVAVLTLGALRSRR